MPITLPCNCGRTLKLRDELAGKRIKCPSCEAMLKVPESEEIETGFEAVEEEQESGTADSRFSPKQTAPAPRPKDDEFDERPRKRRKRMRLPDEYYREFERDERRRRAPSIAVSPAVISGVLMMIGAVVWFVVGLFAGWIFFYPPILFILGLVAVIRGVMGYGEE